MLHDPAFRGRAGLYQGMTANFLYAAFRAAVGIRYRSVWFVSMAIYYLLLGAIRLSLISGDRRGDQAHAWKCYRRTARLLLLLNIPMGGMILLMTLTAAGYSYPGYVIYLSAMYTFYTMICSIVQLARLRRQDNPILRAAGTVHFVAALMSILGLQTAMIAQFSTEGDGFRQSMNAMTGGVIWLAVILLAACMLRRSRKKEDSP